MTHTIVFLSQELEKQNKTLDFDISIKAVSILRYITDHLTRYLSLYFVCDLNDPTISFHTYALVFSDL